MTIVHSAETPNDPQHAIRTDLWNTMTVQELVHQQDLLVNHTLKVQAMMEAQGTSHTVMNMYRALQHAAEQLTKLIDDKSRGNFNT